MQSFKTFLAERLARYLQEREDYRGEHEAPGPGAGAPLHDLKGVYPDDFHGPNGAKYYGDGQHYDHESHGIISRLKGRPNASVKIYRAVPHEPSHDEKIDAGEAAKKHFMKTGKLKGVEPHIKNYDDLHNHVEHLKANRPANEDHPKMKINKGDWVTVSRQYAKDHGEQSLKNKYKILSKTVKASEVYTNGDSIHEQGYHPNEK